MPPEAPAARCASRAAWPAKKVSIRSNGNLAGSDCVGEGKLARRLVRDRAVQQGLEVGPLALRETGAHAVPGLEVLQHLGGSLGPGHGWESLLRGTITSRRSSRTCANSAERGVAGAPLTCGQVTAVPLASASASTRRRRLRARDTMAFAGSPVTARWRMITTRVETKTR